MYLTPSALMMQIVNTFCRRLPALPLDRMAVVLLDAQPVDLSLHLAVPNSLNAVIR
jgi:hypothetical protein